MVPGGLLEREGELARIDGRLAAARAGRGGVLVITGPAGIGKTALLTEAGERAGQAGMRVLAGRGGGGGDASAGGGGGGGGGGLFVRCGAAAFWAVGDGRCPSGGGGPARRGG